MRETVFDEMKTLTDLEKIAAGGGKLPSPREVATKEAQHKNFSRTLADVAPLIPEREDRSVLFKNNWLAYGQVAQLVATSGVGKSSFAMQTAFNWAAGLPFLAEPMRPLKCAIIQSEDSERDVAEQLYGMHMGLVNFEGWSESRFQKIKSEILCPTIFIGKQGKEFIALLKTFQAEMKCDMIFINPIQAFFGGDISNQKDVSAWTRGGLDPIAKDPANPCCFFLVCHTPKFKSGDKNGRANVKDYGEYIFAGSHEWLDYVRANFTFLKHGTSNDYFDFSAPKRGKRLGWRDEDGAKTTNKIFKHSDGFIYWQEVTDPDEIAAIDGGVHRVKKQLSEERVMEVAQQMADWIRANRAVTPTELSESSRTSTAFAGLGFTRHEIRVAGSYVKTNYAKVFHMQFKSGFYGYADGIRTAILQRTQKSKIAEMNKAAEAQECVKQEGE